MSMKNCGTSSLYIGLVFICLIIIAACNQNHDNNSGTLSTKTIDGPSLVTSMGKSVEFDKDTYVKARLPVVHGIGSKEQTKIINDEYIKLYNEAVARVKENYDEAKASGENYGCGYYDFDFEVVAQTKDYVSIQMHVDTYGCGAARNHPRTWIDNYSIKTGKKLKLGDFLGRIPDWRDKLEAELGARNKKREGYMPDWGIDSMLKGRDNTFYVENGYLHVFYNEYEIAPGAAGQIELVLPISSLKKQRERGTATVSHNSGRPYLTDGNNQVIQESNTNLVLSFNLQEKNAALNNNFKVAVSKIVGSPSVWNTASTITADTLTRSPYSWLGKLCKITGEVYRIEELPHTQYGQWSEILLLASNKNTHLGVTTISCHYNGQTNNIRSNEIYTCAGYFVGTYEGQNAMGGTLEGLVIVGNDIRGKNLTHVAPSPQDYDSSSYKQKNIRRTYYESGELKSEIPYENGKKEGMVRVYYKSGKLMQDDPYKNDKKEGIAKAYYESGELKAEAPYKNDKYEGIARIYHKNGNLWKERPFENGKLEGMEIVYSESGRLWGRIVYSNNKAMSGTCGNGRAFTDAELINWGNARYVSCD